MMAHHIGMCCLAVCGVAGLWTYDALFFFGVIEVSGIVLTFIDVFHPVKHPLWVKWLEKHPTISKVNDLGRALFLLAYFIVRAGLFTHLTLTQVFPDVLHVMSLPVAGRRGFSVPFVGFNGCFSLAFMGLQLYWGALLVKQAQKHMFGKGDKKKK